MAWAVSISVPTFFVVLLKAAYTTSNKQRNKETNKINKQTDQRTARAQQEALSSFSFPEPTICSVSGGIVRLWYQPLPAISFPEAAFLLVSTKDARPLG